jgi:hypothetical protein
MTIENPQPIATSPSVAKTAAPAKPAAAKPAAAKPAAKKPVAKKTPAKKPVKAKDTDGTYKVLTGVDDSVFCERVSDHVAHGWTLHGDVAATFNGKNVILAQALVRKKKGKRKK